MMEMILRNFLFSMIAPLFYSILLLRYYLSRKASFAYGCHYILVIYWNKEHGLILNYTHEIRKNQGIWVHVFLLIDNTFVIFCWVLSKG